MALIPLFTRGEFFPLFIFFILFIYLFFFFFFKQKTAYEIVDCDWSSDVCSSDLMPIGTSISPACCTLPVSEKTLVPLLCAVPMAANQSAPLRIIGAMLAKVSTLLIKLGHPQSPDRKSTRLNSSHSQQSRMPSSA